MSTARPFLSVVIPTHNRLATVREAIASCLQAAQWVDLEVIVVDDASTDGTREALPENPVLTLIHLGTNQGAANARNRGLAEARGRYVAFLDSDDVFLPEALARACDTARATGADMLVSGWAREPLHAQPAQRTVFTPPEFSCLADDVLAGRAAPTSAVLYRRGYIAGLRWDAEIRAPDDWDFFCRAALRDGQLESRPEPVYVLRDHSGPRRGRVPMLDYAVCHHRILAKIEQHLARQGALTGARRRRLAQYLYKGIYVLGLSDRVRFEQAVERILDLDPDFVPRDEEPRAYMRALSRVLGFRRAVLLRTAAKRIALFIGGRSSRTPPASTSR